MISLHGKWRTKAVRLSFLAVALTGGIAKAFAQDDGGAADQAGGTGTPQQAYCRQLERQLAPDWQQATGNRDLVPRIEAQMAHADQQYQRSQAAADKADCFEYFLFSKSWRDTPQCRQLHQQIDDAQRAMADLDKQRKGASAAQDHGARQEALVNELARSQCGTQYEAALQHRSTSPNVANYWNDSESLAPGGGGASPGFDNLVPGSTFRTICVRLCDGYYFPISFATTQDHLQRDSTICQGQCGGPAKLYYYPNPGGEVQQAIGMDGTPYASLHNAFRYRKELVSSCTCRGSGDGADAVADTQPMQPDPQSVAPRQSLPSNAPAQANPDGSADPQTGALPPAEFGTMTVVPEQDPSTGAAQTN